MENRTDNPAARAAGLSASLKQARKHVAIFAAFWRRGIPDSVRATLGSAAG